MAKRKSEIACHGDHFHDRAGQRFHRR
jgi:hypothetical protein